MTPTMLTRKDLSERWGCTGTYIDNLTHKGTIHKLKGFPSPHYSLSEILKIEEGGDYKESVETRRLRLQLEEAKAENERLKSFLKTFTGDALKLINI